MAGRTPEASATLVGAVGGGDPWLLIDLAAWTDVADAITATRHFEVASNAGDSSALEMTSPVNCHLVSSVQLGDRLLVVGSTAEPALLDGEQDPSDGLARPDHTPRRFGFARDDAAYRRARQVVLHRQYEPDTVLDPQDLAYDLEVDLASATYALIRLVSDGLVLRDLERGYIVVPLDVRMSDEIFDARGAIELGVVETSLHRVSEPQIVALQAALNAMAAELVGDKFLDFDRYLDANYTFHEQVVMISQNDTLRKAFRQLGIKDIMTRSFGSTRASSQSFIDVQRELFESIAAGDASAARRAIVGYSDLAKARVRTILSLTGGRL